MPPIIIPVGSALFFFASAASSRSAGVPWRSPWPSFLKAYWTVMALLARYWLFIDSIAASAASKSWYEMKPKPLDSPVVGSREIWRDAIEG